MIRLTQTPYAHLHTSINLHKAGAMNCIATSAYEQHQLFAEVDMSVNRACVCEYLSLFLSQWRGFASTHTYIIYIRVEQKKMFFLNLSIVDHKKKQSFW